MGTNVDKIRDDLARRLDWRSEHVSNTARRLALAVIALVWGLLTLDGTANIPIQAWQHDTLVISGVVAMFSLFCDWLQAVIGYIQVDRDFDRVQRSDYDPAKDHAFHHGFAYRLTVGSFWAKQIFAPLAAVLLLIAVAPSLITTS